MVTSAAGGQLVGQRLGNYQLEALLGIGGMAEVYRARDPKGRVVAVKVLPHFLANDPGYVKRFEEEGERAAALKHDHIVPIYERGSQGDLLYLVMPLLKESLRDRLERERLLAPQDAERIISGIAGALETAHRAGLVHRDVKPENILLDDKGKALLTDFGIARRFSSRQGGTLYTLSASGLPVGTPEYMAPEQLKGEHIDQRADIYGLGAVLYELLTGTVPHPADTPYEVAARVLTEPASPPSTRNPKIWRELEEVVLGALAARPEDRYQDMRTFARDLRGAVLPPGTGLLTGMPAFRRMTRRFSRRPATEGARPVNVALEQVPTMPPAVLAGQEPASTSTWPTVGPAAQPGWGPRMRTSPPPKRRAMVFGAVAAVLLLAVCGGGTLAYAGRYVFARPQPTVTAQPTATATLEPTPTIEPTATPIALLTISPMQLIRVSSTLSRGQQYITNNTGRPVSWQWKSSQPDLPTGSSGFKWGLSGSASTTIPPLPNHSSLSPGETDTLIVSMPYKSQDYKVTLTDSLGRTYTFTMQAP